MRRVEVQVMAEVKRGAITLSALFPDSNMTKHPTLPLDATLSTQCHWARKSLAPRTYEFRKG
jgi:hypothetical protein